MVTEKACEIGILIIQPIIITSYQGVLPLKGKKHPWAKLIRIFKY